MKLSLKYLLYGLSYWAGLVTNFGLVTITVFNQLVFLLYLKRARSHNAHLSYTIFRLILIRIDIDHKGGKALPYNTSVFPNLKLETTN